MKLILWIVTAIMLTFVTAAFATTTGPGRDLGFQRYDRSYFERNDTGLTTQTSYLIFTGQAQFDRIFGAAPIMGRNNFLPTNVFNTKIVIATIARGHFLRTYNDLKVTTKDGKIYVSYEAKDTHQKSATFASPLILAVNDGRYSEAIFIENGKRAGAATFPKTK